MAAPRSTKTRARSATRKKKPQEVDIDREVEELADASDEEDQVRPVSRRMTEETRVRAELAAILQSKRTGKPVFPPPPELPEDQLVYWSELVNSKPHDYFNNGDMPLLKLYCRVASDVDRLDREIRAEGEVISNARGNPVVNPKVMVRAINETRLLALAVKLRAQPASRYESSNDKEQTQKKKRAEQAAAVLEDSGDEDEGLLAGGVAH